ncbi:MAG: ATP-dependent DNA helicase [Verrucomicrobiota bacterium]
MVIDPDAKTISLSVRDLAADTGFARIGFGREGWGGFATGLTVHERVLASRVAANASYRKEIHLEASVAVDGWTAVITGRIDGCLEENGAAHLEEFKTASLVVGRPARLNPGFARHSRQLLTYCDLWTRRGQRVASARLVYVDADSAQEESVELEFDPQRQAAETEARLRVLLAEWKARAALRLRKAAYAFTLRFPHQAPRPGQRQLMSAINDALDAGGILLAEAPTGSGKTAASLHAGLQHALRTGRQLVFLTSKTLQQTMAVNTLAAMNPDGLLRIVQLRAKEKMCANDRVFCHEDVCRFARHYPLKMERSRLRETLGAEKELSPEKIFADAKACEVCPFEVQLELARSADVIVADYNYVFDPASALTHLRDEGLREVVLVIDEAHNLPDRVRAIFSPELILPNLLAAREAARRLDGPVVRRGNQKAAAKNRQLDFSATLTELAAPFPELETLIRRVMTLVEESARAALSDKDGAAEAEISPEDFVAAWDAWQPALQSYIAWKQTSRRLTEDDPIVEFHFELQRFIAVLRLRRQGAAGFACVVERRQGRVRLALPCLDPSDLAAPIFKQVSAAVFLSATLQPFELFRQTLGLEASRISQASVASPFPPENRRILILPQVRTSFSVREKNLPPIARLIAEMDAAAAGNKLVLLPSFDFLQRVVAQLRLEHSTGGFLEGRLEVQLPGASDAERKGLLQKLAAPPPGGVLLCAVLGGMFAEGVDYPGALLETVIVVSPGLPQLSFERELLRRHFDQRSGNGFEFAYLQPGMTRVIQAAGRLIRTETDRGVVALLCGRFLEEPYCGRLPRDWYRNSPRELISENPGRDIREFFSFNGGKTEWGPDVSSVRAG